MSAAQDQKNVLVIDHPVVKHKITMLRDEKTTPLSFRLITEEISQFLAYEATRDLSVKNQEITTPLEKTTCEVVGEELVLVSIMRAGLGMLSGMLRILPFATVGHIGIYRDKFIQATVEYYLRLPKNVKGKRILILDPLLASGDTACAAIARLKEYEVGPIRFVCFLASKEGIARVHQEHPDVEIYTCNIERAMNDKGYLLPGLGDAGDRLYDTLEY
ncbi:uracil phosphoribosyltransferase [bacterium]|nr:uracil phosphoribosyltransferase [bacterium]